MFHRTQIRSVALVLGIAGLIGTGTGCNTAQISPVAATGISNPIAVRAQNPDLLWEQTIDVLHRFSFEIEREDRLTGVIETEYSTGSSCLEPWRHDSVGHENRLESTLQSIRRKVRVRLGHADGSYVVSVEAYKEKEDLPGLAANSPGAATFRESAPLERDLNPVVGQTTASGWIPVGRDIVLERAILSNLQRSWAG